MKKGRKPYKRDERGYPILPWDQQYAMMQEAEYLKMKRLKEEYNNPKPKNK